MAILIAQNLLALFVVWHKYANTHKPPDILAPSADFTSIKRLDQMGLTFFNLVHYYTAQAANALFLRLNLAPGGYK